VAHCYIAEKHDDSIILESWRKEYADMKIFWCLFFDSLVWIPLNAPVLLLKRNLVIFGEMAGSNNGLTLVKLREEG